MSLEKNIYMYIDARMWRLCKTGIGLTTGFIGSHTVTHNYSVYTLQLTAHYTRAESSHLCLHWLPVFQHRRTCSPSEPTGTDSLTELTVLCSVTHLYSRGTWLRLLLHHSRNTSRHVYRAAAARASAILFAASHSTVAWLPSKCCKQTPYCLQHARHNILLRTILENV
jgi:hypothetical protein